MQMVRTRHFVILVLVSALGGWASISVAEPLRVHPSNPRYFTDGSGRAIYLTGAHTWQNLTSLTPAQTFDWAAYLALLRQYNHNYIRLWSGWITQGGTLRADQPPWNRPGPGNASDGQPKWDFTLFNQAHFDRIRANVLAARAVNMYVGINLFTPARYQVGDSPWLLGNNINGINGDLNGNGELRDEVERLGDAAIISMQEAYITKVIDTVNDLDNVLYEICNECTPISVPWQYQMINFIKGYESTKPFQHPVGMSADGAQAPNNLAQLLASPADWIAPGFHETFQDYAFDPPAATGAKVILLDSDHVFGQPGNRTWVWQSFMRGNQPNDMEAIQVPLPSHPGAPWNDLNHPDQVPNRIAMGQTKTFADRLNLAMAVPHGELASTNYCLANPGQEYLVYVPFGGGVTVDLTAVGGTVSVEWFNPATSAASNGGTASGGGNRSFTAPFSGDAVLYLKSSPAVPLAAPTGLTVQ